MQQALYEYMNPIAEAKVGTSCNYTLGVNFTSNITAVATGTPTKQLSAEANGGYDAWYNTHLSPAHDHGITLNSSGSADFQGHTITAYYWGLQGTGAYSDAVRGQSERFPQAPRAACGERITGCTPSA